MVIVFLPGASGRRVYWQPVADQLNLGSDILLLGWPGFDDVPTDPSIQSLTDLVDYVLGQVKEPINLVAHSMGGVVALLLTLRRPDLVRRLVLSATSGGVDVSRFGGEDWRRDYLNEMPEMAPRWFVDDCSNLTTQIPMIQKPTLLLWGEEDRISSPAVGRYLASLLPCSQFQTIPGAGHMLADEKPIEVAARIQAFLAA